MQNQNQLTDESKRSRRGLLSFMTFLLGLIVLGLYQNCGPTDPYGSEGRDSFGLNVRLDVENIKLAEFTDADTYPKVEIPIINEGANVAGNLTLNVLATVDDNAAVAIKYDVESEILNGPDRKAVITVDCYNVNLNCTFQDNTFLSLTINLDGVEGADFAQVKFNLETGEVVEDGSNPPGGGSPTATVPEAPAIEVSSNATKIFVTWTAPADGGSTIIRYEVERQRSTFLGLIYTSEGITNVQGATMLEVSSGIQSGSRYRFRVRAVNAVGPGGYSGFSGIISLQ